MNKLNEEAILALYEALENAIENVNHFHSVQDAKLEDMWRDIAGRYAEQLRLAGEE